MAYVTGTAADMSAVKTALVNACTANGWTAQTDASDKTVLSNSGCYVRVEVGTDNQLTSEPTLEVLGRTGLNSGDAPGVVRMRYIDDGAITINFPVTYHAFVFSTEVYFVINWSNYYEYVAFGQSQQSGLPGTGNWVVGFDGQSTEVYDFGVSITSTGDYATYSNLIGLFWGAAGFKSYSANAWVHNDFEASYPWACGDGSAAGDNYASPTGIRYLTELIDAQPNQFSGEGVLLPIRAYKTRPESKITQLLELEYARHIRIDHYTPEQVITLGTDEWMVFPYFSKDASNPDGGTRIHHSGTFGMALKKA